jgi:hypothetical protein
MLAFLSSLTLATSLICGLDGEPAEGSYLHPMECCRPGVPNALATVYVPQEGDLVLFDDRSPTWLKLYHMVGSDVPDHSGIVFRLPDGRLALLESAPDDGKLAGMYVRLLHVLSRLHQFQGTIYVRQVRTPLNPEQSASLTEFALAQEGKRYAICRMLLQATPFRCRTGWRAKLFAKTDLNRSSWLCSELVVAAGTAAGLFDPNVVHANNIYPRDMLYDDHYDLSQTWHTAQIWSPSPEAPIVEPPKVDSHWQH